MNKIISFYLISIFQVACGQSIPTIREVYNFNVGDIFEYQTEIFGGGKPSDTMGYKYSILERKTSVNKDTITYKIRVDAYDGSGIFSSEIIDTSYMDLDSSVQIYFRSKFKIIYHISYFADTVYFHSIWNKYIYDYSASDGHLGFSGKVINGLGVVESFFSDAFTGYLTRLTYYKKGNDEFGVIDKKYELEIDNYNFPNIKIFPNPVKTEIKLSLPFHSNTNIFIIDHTGQTILTFNKINSRANLDVKSICPGIYFLIFDINGKKNIKKFLKE